MSITAIDMALLSGSGAAPIGGADANYDCVPARCGAVHIEVGHRRTVCTPHSHGSRGLEQTPRVREHTYDFWRILIDNRGCYGDPPGSQRTFRRSPTSSGFELTPETLSELHLIDAELSTELTKLMRKDFSFDSLLLDGPDLSQQEQKPKNLGSARE